MHRRQYFLAFRAGVKVGVWCATSSWDFRSPSSSNSSTSPLRSRDWKHIWITQVCVYFELLSTMYVCNFSLLRSAETLPDPHVECGSSEQAPGQPEVHLHRSRGRYEAVLHRSPPVRPAEAQGEGPGTKNCDVDIWVLGSCLVSSEFNDCSDEIAVSNVTNPYYRFL